MLIKLDQFAPDADFSQPGVITSLTSMVPSLRGYKAAPTAQSANLNALAATCYGAAVVRRLDNATRFIAGTATKLYELNGASWTDVSGSAYSATSDRLWSFAQFGNVTLAVNKADTLQYSNSSGAFANVTGAPKAKLVETVNQFVLVADTDDGGTFGDSPDRWWCSGIGTYDDWTPNTATQCVSGRLTSAPGRITALKRLGDGIVAYKDRAMFVGSYVGSPEVWTFQEVPGQVGCQSQGGVVDIGAAHVFVGYDNFYIFDGSRPTAIGNPIKDWFFSRLYTDYAYRIKTMHDRTNSNIYFFYPSNSGNGALDACVVFNYRVNKWGVDNRTIEASIDFVSSGLTYDSSFASTYTYDTVDSTLTYDSPLLVAGRPAPAYFDTAHTVYLLTGAGNAWGLTTSDFGDDNQVSLLSRVKPRWLTKPTSANLQNWYRMNEGDGLTADATTTMYESRFDVLRGARWHRLDMSGSGGAELAMFDIVLKVDGYE